MLIWPDNLPDKAGAVRAKPLAQILCIRPLVNKDIFYISYLADWLHFKSLPENYTEATGKQIISDIIRVYND